VPVVGIPIVAARLCHGGSASRLFVMERGLVGGRHATRRHVTGLDFVAPLVNR
jgi:hypothetical protein